MNHGIGADSGMDVAYNYSAEKRHGFRLFTTCAQAGIQDITRSLHVPFGNNPIPSPSIKGSAREIFKNGQLREPATSGKRSSGGTGTMMTNEQRL